MKAAGKKDAGMVKSRQEKYGMEKASIVTGKSVKEKPNTNYNL